MITPIIMVKDHDDYDYEDGVYSEFTTGDDFLHIMKVSSDTMNMSVRGK